MTVHATRRSSPSASTLALVAAVVLSLALAVLTAATTPPQATPVAAPAALGDGSAAAATADAGGGSSATVSTATTGASPRADAPPATRAVPAASRTAVSVPAPTRPAAAGEVEDEAPAPVAVHIPALGVRSPTLAMGLEDDGRLEVPRDAADAGWWSGGVRPGERGPAVVVGHVDSRSGPGVFVGLTELRRDDVVLIERDDGSLAHFAVRGREQHPKAAFPTDRVYGDTSDARLRLITCGGAFDADARSYVDNVIVDLELLGWS